MGLFSIFSKNKQESTAQDSGRFSRDDDNLAERARAKRAAYAGEAAAASRRSRSGGDPMLPEKKRARRRLVGAIALALAAAVGLPMLLDSEPRPLVGDIAIQIPAKDKAPALPAPSDPVPAAESVDQGEEIVEAPPATPPVARTQEAPAAAMPPPVKTVEVAKAEPREPVRTEPAHKPEPKPEPKKPEPKVAEHKPEPKKPEPKAAEKPAPKKADDKPLPARAKDEDAARALALLEGKAAARPAEKPEASQRFVVQVAALASEDKVAELQTRLRAAGVSAHTRKSGELIRVQVGPFGSREEAEKARAKLGAQGFSGFLVPM